VLIACSLPDQGRLLAVDMRQFKIAEPRVAQAQIRQRRCTQPLRASSFGLP
jgi:hypothetical protein